jgi:hypothetical protein
MELSLLVATTVSLTLPPSLVFLDLLEAAYGTWRNMHRARFVPTEVGTGHGRRALVLPSRLPLWVVGFVARLVRTSALQPVLAGTSLCSLFYSLVVSHGEMVCG